MQVAPEAIASVASFTPAPMLQSASRLVSSDALFPLHSRRSDEGLDLEFTIQDGKALHQAEVFIRDSGELDGWCSCGSLTLCVHTTAGVLFALTVTDPPAQRPAWQKELDEALPTDRETDTQLCLFVGVHKPTGSNRGYYERTPRRAAYLGARPGVMGSRGTWIKGNVKWSQFFYDDGSPAGKALGRLVQLHQLGPNAENWYGTYLPDWMPLDGVAGDDLWVALHRIQDAGVAIVSAGKAQHPVEFRTGEVAVDATLTRKGSTLRLGAEMTLDGHTLASERTWWLGSPPTVLARVHDAGTADERVELFRASRPVAPVAQQLLTRSAAMTIKDEDRESFLTDYLPRIQSAVTVRSPDKSVEIPAMPLAKLELSITYAAPQIHLAWSWRRPQGAVRDRAHERSITDAVGSAAGPLANLLTGAQTARGAADHTSRASADHALADHTLGQANAVLFVAEVLPKLREIESLTIVENEEPPAYRAATQLPQVGIRTEGEGDWFDLNITVSVDGEEVDFAELFTALTLDDPVFLLPSGTYFPLDAPEFDRLRAIIEEARALSDRPVDRLRVSRYQVDLWQELVELGIVTAQESAWWLAVQSLATDAVMEQVDAPPTLLATLREYQRSGLAWLEFLRTNGLGGILADDMGLGKTLQAIAMMERARLENVSRPPFLVVAPTSVVGNWARECRRFAPELNVVTITATGKRRGETITETVAGAHVVVTSYTLFREEAAEYRNVEWSGLILDEAQQIKNASSKGYKAARMLGAPSTLVITGTPMENNLDELWALVSLAAPGLLGSRQQFTETYRRPIEREKDAELLARLRRRIRPFLLRRTKEVVATELPPKQEQVLEIDLHPRHRHLYDVHFQRERQNVLGLIDDVNANRFQIFRSLTHLRQLALDPALVDAGDAPSAKLDALIELLTDAAEEGHRVLVLSQFTRFLVAARDRADAAGLAFAYLDGSTMHRDRVIDGFRDGDAPVFFVSLKAGGFGLNLVEADYVVLLDPWWNPAVEEQAIDRAHRIGQTRPVIVYRLVSTDTIEEKVIALRETKAALFARVFDEGGSVGGGTITADDIRELLG
ncbi:DEAD/DEAH box helicase [Humibacter sp.]|uniref:DEAD/DEAH box helicase n=1 Tax=Humibacter sp. TaxID=1940291 RepID=UPI003F80C9CA